MLHQQFHDIIPGSSIAWVHADAEAAHARRGAELEARSSATGAARTGSSPADAATSSNAATHVDRDEVIDGRRRRPSALVEVPGSRLAPLVAASTVDDRVVVTDRSMTNGHLAVRWDLDGNIISIIDVAPRPRAAAGRRAAAVLELAPDHPVRYDAWDLESWTPVARPTSCSTAESVEVVDAADRCSAGVARPTAVRPSSRDRDLHDARRIAAARHRARLDWHDDEHLLSLAFPLDVRADTATCDIQFGHVRRPTHPASSWDAAKFEVCAHRYVDVAEPVVRRRRAQRRPLRPRRVRRRVRVSLLRAPRATPIPTPTTAATP